MFEVRPLPEFVTWLGNLADKTVRAAVLARIDRLELGLKETFSLLAKAFRRCGFI